MTETPDTGEVRTTATAAVDSQGGLRVSRWLPWLVALPMLLAFWFFEAGLHSLFFDQRAFLNDLLAPDAHELWMRFVVSMMLLGVASVWSSAVNERNQRVSELAEHKARLRAMAARLAKGESAERRELSNRLHEHVAQTLTAARMFISVVEPADDDSRAALRSAERVLEGAIADCREVAQELSPPVLDQFGLGPALDQLARRIMRRAGISVEVDADSSLPLARDVLLASYEVTVEVLEEAVADPATSFVRIHARRAARDMEIVLEWDGASCGDSFESSERMLGVGGAVEQSVTQGRCTVLLRAPIAA